VSAAPVPLRFARLIGVILTLGIAILPPLCHASPPDPTWIAGLYDDADYDDVVLDVLATVAVPVAALPSLLAPMPARPASPPAAPEAPGRRGLVARSDRAPPLA
jgi:hypothetical protein